ncbi:N-acetylmuramoyl-L-alanine amidase [Bacillus shivajii]|uniref:N-acetylmuramoyl-L-alanine amidase n=1 Tax=Bacillus shivajii TaxID=1983719 RepID=UPI001CFAE720|nr:N-acetylmuramoyl-L-alanine amidase [Bacillus shivajii]UCZ52724.1 N-acetylmuramoyl-L-alanine amidase [Bacillus shivajii]
MQKFIIFFKISLIFLLALGLIPIETKANSTNDSDNTVNAQSVANPASISRIDGANLYETSALISSKGWSQADTVIIARGDRFSDALAGVPLAAKYDAPLLLSRNNRLDSFTKNELQRLSPKKVIILGGHLAIEESVENDIRALNIQVERLAGNNMHDTAELIANEVAPNGSEKAFIVTDSRFEDALSIASYAGVNEIPILLTEKDSLPQQTSQALSELDVEKVYALGGDLVISESALSQINVDYERIYGQTRFDTNTKVLNRFNLNSNKAYIATSDRFPDGLSGGALAAKQRADVVLVGDNIHQTTENHLLSKSYRDLFVLGGELAVNSKVYGDLHTILEDPTKTVFRLGDYHSKVIELRNSLADAGYSTSDQPKNYFGPSTRTAVTDFQRDSGITVDGVAGPQTFSTLREAVSNQKTYGYVSVSTTLNVRSGPGTSYSIIDSLSNNTKVEILETTSNDWHKIGYDGKIGYVSAQFVELVIPSDGSLEGKKIILDPGHGGSDPGGIGNGIIEKDLVLDISLKARQILEDAGATVIMTRTDDTYLTLSQRSTLANSSSADIFISVHANLFNGVVQGTETFWHGRYERSRSISLANSIQDSVVEKMGTRYRRVAEGNFHVVRETKIPSTLLEVAFMDHPDDAAKLKQSSYRQRAAEGIYEGVLNYFK